jgi:hypothetical protein
MFKAGITTLFSALVLQTGVFAQIYVKSPGNVGIGMQNPDRKLQVDGHTEIGDAHDGTRYGILQLTRPASLPDDKFHLSLIKAGNSVSGFGYVPNTNSFALWACTNTNTITPTMAFPPGGNVGIGVTNPIYKLQVGGFTEIGDNEGVYDPTRYGLLQLIRPASQGDDKFHLSFIRGGNAIAGMGFANNSNNFGIWAYAGQGTISDPVIGITPDLFVGIGTSAPTCKLHVAGNVRGDAFFSVSHTYADYVFNSDYKLPSLQDVKAYIQQNHHLPEVPTEEDVKKNGINLGDQSVILLKKVEELTLYVIDQNEKLQALEQKVSALQEENSNLKVKNKKRRP